VATPVYRVLINRFTNASGGDFSVGDLVVDVTNPKHLCYAEYVNDIGEAFFTIMQSSREASLLLTDVVDVGAHVRIYRDDALMWGGWLGETDEANNDVIVYAYSYAAGLYTRHTGWEQEFLNAQINTIFSTLWDRARGVSPVTTGNRMGWMTMGTLEVPVTTSGGATPYEQGKYTTYYKRILFAFQELVAAAISDTTNRVVWEITPAGVLNLWKNRGTDLTGLAFHYGDPKLLSYRRQRTPVDRRTYIYAVGTTPRDVALKSEKWSSPDLSAMGRVEESIYLQWVRDQTELDRVASLRTVRAVRRDSEFGLSFAPGKLTPFRATGQSYKLTDGVHVEFANGATQMSETKLIVGQQVLLYRGQEIVRPMLADRL
jgi:hypothetical protein